MNFLGEGKTDGFYHTLLARHASALRMPHARRYLWFSTRFYRIHSVGSKLKCPVFVASEMSGFKVVPSPIGLG